MINEVDDRIEEVPSPTALQQQEEQNTKRMRWICVAYMALSEIRSRTLHDSALVGLILS